MLWKVPVGGTAITSFGVHHLLPDGATVDVGYAKMSVEHAKRAIGLLEMNNWRRDSNLPARRPRDPSEPLTWLPHQIVVEDHEVDGWILADPYDSTGMRWVIIVQMSDQTIRVRGTGLAAEDVRLERLAGEQIL